MPVDVVFSSDLSETAIGYDIVEILEWTDTITDAQSSVAFQQAMLRVSSEAGLSIQGPPVASLESTGVDRSGTIPSGLDTVLTAGDSSTGVLPVVWPGPTLEDVPRTMPGGLEGMFEDDSALQSDEDEDEDEQNIALKETLARIETRLKEARERPVRPDLAAELFNELRRYGPRFRGQARAVSNDDLMSKVTPEKEAKWWEAQGLTPQDVNDFKRGAMLAGLINPLGTLLMNAVNYIGAPGFGLAAGSAWANFGTGVAASVLSPLVNAWLQSGTVEICEQARERAGFSVKLDKNQIHDRHWPAELASKVTTAAKDFAANGEALRRHLNALLREPELSADGMDTYSFENRDLTVLDPVDVRRSVSERHTLEANEVEDEDESNREKIVAALQNATPQQLTEIQATLASFQLAELEIESQQQALFMTQGSWERQKIGNSWQIIPRAARSPFSTLVGLGRGQDPDDANLDEQVSRISKYSEGANVGIQAAISMVIFAGNMGAAAFDIKNQHEYNNKLNLIYGDCLTEAGSANFAAGDVSAEDIDSDRLRGFLVSPEQALVNRISAIVDSTVKNLDEKINRRLARAKSPEPLELEEGFGVPKPIAIMQAMLADLKVEREHLKSGDLSRLPLDGMSAAILEGNSESFFSKLITKGVLAKYRKVGETSAQTGQRVGQTFHLLIFGSGAAAVVGKLGSAIVGGASRMSTPQNLGLVSTGLVLALAGAYYQSAAVNVKNNRRDNEGGDNEIGFMTQVLRGMRAGPIMHQAASKALSANAQVKQALSEATDIGRKAIILHAALEELQRSSPRE
jgi:uncharacterized membrane protein